MLFFFLFYFHCYQQLILFFSYTQTTDQASVVLSQYSSFKLNRVVLVARREYWMLGFSLSCVCWESIRHQICIHCRFCLEVFEETPRVGNDMVLGYFLWNAPYLVRHFAWIKTEKCKEIHMVHHKIKTSIRFQIYEYMFVG